MNNDEDLVHMLKIVFQVHTTRRQQMQPSYSEHKPVLLGSVKPEDMWFLIISLSNCCCLQQKNGLNYPCLFHVYSCTLNLGTTEMQKAYPKPIYQILTLAAAFFIPASLTEAKRWHLSFAAFGQQC